MRQKTVYLETMGCQMNVLDSELVLGQLRAKGYMPTTDMAAAALFRQIAKIEAHHRDRYKRLLDMVEKGTVYKREKPIKWKCGVCGYVHEGTEPPEKCPCCQHPKEYYEPANMDF